MVELSHQEKQTHGLLTVDLPEADAEREAEGRIADAMAEEVAGDYADANQPVVAEVERPDGPLITKEAAIERLGPKVMAALTDKFNGSLTDIRHRDGDDMLC